MRNRQYLVAVALLLTVAACNNGDRGVDEPVSVDHPPQWQAAPEAEAPVTQGSTPTPGPAVQQPPPTQQQTPPAEGTAINAPR